MVRVAGAPPDTVVDVGRVVTCRQRGVFGPRETGRTKTVVFDHALHARVNGAYGRGGTQCASSATKLDAEEILERAKKAQYNVVVHIRVLFDAVRHERVCDLQQNRHTAQQNGA